MRMRIVGVSVFHFLTIYNVSHTFHLALTTAVSPVRKGSVPLIKCGTLTKPDGKVDLEKLIFQGIVTKKYVLSYCRTA